MLSVLFGVDYETENIVSPGAGWGSSLTPLPLQVWLAARDSSIFADY